MRGIEISEHAQKRLHEIIDYYLLEESVDRASKVLDSFDDSFFKIASNPFAYKNYYSSEFLNLDIRVYTHFKTYHIYFVVYPESIRIAEIFHLKQDVNKLHIDVEV